MKRADRERLIWAAVSAGAVLSASLLARRGADAAWRYLRDEEPPRDPADPNTRWRTLAAWTLISGIGAAAARLTGQALATKAWQKRLGRLPPSR